MFKKFIAYILTVSVLLSMLVVNVSAADEGISAERVTKFENAVTLLTKLGAISEEDAYGFDTGISKAQFVALMAKIVPVSDGAETPVFSDVPETHENFKEIQGFVDAGYISGHAGSFEPDRDITYNEALYIVMNTMGYKDFMNLVAAYPAGGWQLAGQLDIKMKNKGAVAGDIFYMLYQALTTDMLSISGMKEGRFVFSNKNGETLLEKYFEVEVATGILKSNGKISISGQYEAEDGIVVVDDVAYRTKSDCTVLPGCEVDVFYSIDTKDLVFVAATAKNEITEINSVDIEGFKNLKYSYKANGVSKALKIKDGTEVVINNQLATAVVEEDMVPANGKIIAVNSGRSNGCDVVYVKDYVSFVVKSLNSDNKKVTIAADTASGIDPVIAYIEENAPIILDAEGNELAIEDIAIGTVVSVMGINDGDNIIAGEIVTSDAIATGALTTISKGDTMYLTIEDVAYPVAECAEYIVSSLSPQIDMTFFVDFMGNIVALDDSISGSMAFGYILGVDEGINDEGDECIVVKVFSEIGSIIKYKVSIERLTVDGVRSAKYYGPGDYDEYKSKFAANIGKLIRYDVNNNRELSKVDFSESINTATTSTVDDRLYLSLDNNPSTNGSLTQYYSSKKSFANNVHLDDDTIIFKLPDIPEDAEESEYKIIRSAGGLKDGRYAIESYKLGTDMLYSKVLVVQEMLDPTLSADHLGNTIVKDVTKVLDQYGEETYSITFEGLKGEMTYQTKTKRVAEEPISIDKKKLGRTVVPGDIVRCFLDESETVIAQVVICYDFVENVLQSASYTENWALDDGTYALGYIYAMDDKRISIGKGNLPTKNLFDNECQTYLVDNFKIYKVEVTDNGERMAGDILPATKADLKSFKTSGGNCSRVLSISSRGTGQLLFIFE